MSDVALWLRCPSCGGSDVRIDEDPNRLWFVCLSDDCTNIEDYPLTDKSEGEGE